MYLTCCAAGINDVGKSFWWTNETVEETNARVLASYFERLALLRGEFDFILTAAHLVDRYFADAGARNFLLVRSLMLTLATRL